MATGVEAGQQYVVDGAIFKCQYGSAPCQIAAISNQKVTAQNKPIVTDKDVTFKIPTAPFVTCSQNTQVPTCVYANGIWKTKTTVQHGDQNAIVEKSVMKCPVYQGEIKCIYPGQIQSVSAPELAEFKIETLSNFPLALVVTPPAKNQEDKEKKVSKVYHVSASKTQVRSDETITLHALDKAKNELKPYDIVNWAVTTRKKTEEKVKGKTVSKEHIDKLTLIKRVYSPFNISFHEPGIYYIEGGSDNMVNKYSSLKTEQQLIPQKGIIYPPFDHNCKAVVEVLESNSITGIKKVGDKNSISDTDIVYVKQGVSAVFTPELKLDYNPNFEQLKCLVLKQNGESVLEEDYKYDEAKHSLTITPSSAEVDYRITFSLYKKTDETVEETPMSEKNILVHSYNVAVLYAYLPGNSPKGSANGNTTLRRPGDTLVFSVKQKDGKAENLDKIVWNVKKDGKPLESNIKGEMILYKFKQEGVYTIEADLKDTSLSNGGVKGDILTDFDEESANPENKNVLILDDVQKKMVNEDGKNSSSTAVTKENHKERIITHKLKISRNEVTEVKLGATNGKRYTGVRYTIDPSFLFGDATFWEEKNDVVYTCEGADAECLKKGIFLANKPGDYIINAKLNDKECKSQSIKIQETTFSKWEFCDSQKKKIRHIGRNMEFGINASVPAWAQNGNEEKKQERKITIAVLCKNKTICSFKTKLDETGSFHIDNIDVEKDIIENAKKSVSFDGHQDFIINFVAYDCPSNIVNGLSVSKVGHGLFSANASLTVKTKPFIDGFFADKNGKKIVELLSYDDEVYVHLQMLNQSKNTLEKLRLRVYENKYGVDPVVYEAEHITLNKDNSADIKIEIKKEVKDSELDNLKFSRKKGIDDKALDNLKFSDESSLPRVFYFMVVETDDWGIVKNSQWAYIDDFYKRFVYPPVPGDLYNLNSNELKTLVDSEKQELKKPNPEFQKRSKARNYYYQLKLVSKKEDNEYANMYNHLAPVVVGEDWEEEEKEEESGCKCPNCDKDITLEELKKICVDENGKCLIKDTSRTSAILPYLNKYRKLAHISTCTRKAHFVAQVCAETKFYMFEENFTYSSDALKDIKQFKTEEGKKKANLWGYNAAEVSKDPGKKVVSKENQENIANWRYAKLNGNGDFQSGDGYKYRGRGLIHLTGKDNYKNRSKECNIRFLTNGETQTDWENSPNEVATNYRDVVLSALCYWSVCNINQYAEKATDKCGMKITQVINNDVNAWDMVKENKRKPFFLKAVDVFKVNECKKNEGIEGQEKTNSTFDHKFEIKSNETDIAYIDVIAPAARNREGVMVVFDNTGIRFKTYCLCRGSHRAREKNEGDTPTGLAKTKYLKTHIGDERYGNSGCIYLYGEKLNEKVNGEFYDVMYNNGKNSQRDGLAIHAGHTRLSDGKTEHDVKKDTGRLMQTQGCIRVYNAEMEKLVSVYETLVKEGKTVKCYVEDYNGDITDVFDYYCLDLDFKDKIL